MELPIKYNFSLDKLQQSAIIVGINADRVIENIETNRGQVLGTLPSSVRNSVGFFIGVK